MVSEGLAIFVGVGIVEDAEIGVVAALGDEIFVKSLTHGAVWFVGVGAVAVAAVLSDFENFGEEVGDFMPVHFDGSETAHSGGVDDPSAVVAGDREHFGECGCVHACVVGIGDFGCSEV